MSRTVLLLFYLIGLQSVAGWNLILTPNEERLQNRRSGDNFLVVCKVKDFDGAASDVKIEWYRDGKLIPRFGSTMTIERTYSNQLMINRPKIPDGGKYTCRTEINGEEQEVSADISFVDPPKFVNMKEEQHPEEGTRAEIVCEVEGTDQLEVFWQFNGVTIDETSQRSYEFSENNQILYIPHFTAKKDDGLYNCNAAQYSSFETLTINVTGYARPTITVFDVPSGNRGIEGHTIELKCGAVGKPKPTYKWFFEDDEVPITRSDKHNVDEGLLIIDSLNFEDAGNYKCVANNSIGSNERNFDLVVFLKPKVDLRNQHVAKEGEDLDITCTFNGEGPISAKFISGSREYLVKPQKNANSEEDHDEQGESPEKTTAETSSSHENLKSVENDVLLDSGSDGENRNEKEDEDDKKESEEKEKALELQKWKRSVNNEDSEKISIRSESNKIVLTIKRISLEDAADYTCSVTNEAGTTKKVTQIGIIHPPALRHYTGPKIRSFDGNTVTIYCDVSAVPSPKWIWYKDGKEVEANGASIKIDSQTSSSRLTLENSADNDNFGVYTCHADNGVGHLEKQIQVIRVVKPDTPVGVDCKKLIYPNYGKCSFDSTTFKSEDSRPQTLEVLIAKLEDMESDYDWSHAEKLNVEFENDTTIRNLAVNTQYVIKVRAVNEAGSSEYTEEISLETTDPWAPQSPTSLSMECSEYCSISWEAPNDHGSPLLKYRVSVQEMQLKNNQIQRISTSTAESSELTAEKENSVEVNNEDSASNSNEEGNEVENAIHSEEIIPHAKSIEDSAEILPTDSPTSNENREENEKIPLGNPVILDIDAEEHKVELHSIKPHSYYTISVAAINSVGQGEPAEIEHQTDESPSKYDDGDDTFWFIIAISTGVIFLLFLVDLGCFLTNRCGLISCICLNVCGKNSGTKQRDLESGRSGPEGSRLLDTRGARFMQPLTTTV